MENMYEYLKSSLKTTILYETICNFEEDCKKMKLGDDYSFLIDKYNLVSNGYPNDRHLNLLPYHDGQLSICIKHEANEESIYSGSFVSFVVGSITEEGDLFTLSMKKNLSFGSFSLNIEIHNKSLSAFNFQNNIKASYSYYNNNIVIVNNRQNLHFIKKENDEDKILNNLELISIVIQNFVNLDLNPDLFNLLYDIKIENSVVLQSILKISQSLKKLNNHKN